jgi:amino acid transporter
MARKLSLAEVTAVGIGGMIGGGIFAVLGLAIAQAGRARNRVRGARTPPASPIALAPRTVPTCA